MEFMVFPCVMCYDIQEDVICVNEVVEAEGASLKNMGGVDFCLAHHIDRVSYGIDFLVSAF